MSRAFVKEDNDVPERSSGRRRSASGLPPGAVNYMTKRGAARLREDAARRRTAGDLESATEIDRILASATIIEHPAEVSDVVTIGVTVVARYADGTEQTFHIVGVDETGFEPNAVSWVSPIGRALLGADLGSQVSLEDGTKVTIEKIEHRD